MKLDRYPLKAGANLTTFEFVSEGKNRSITKLVLFTATDYKNLYTLAFGDKDDLTGDIDDTVVSNNRDSEKVLATIVAAIYAFTDHNKNAWIYATGSTDSRNRLYRMGINKFWHEAKVDFEIFGQLNDEWGTVFLQ